MATLTLPMLKLLLFEVEGRKDLGESSKGHDVGIGWIALTDWLLPALGPAAAQGSSLRFCIPDLGEVPSSLLLGSCFAFSALRAHTFSLGAGASDAGMSGFPLLQAFSLGGAAGDGADDCKTYITGLAHLEFLFFFNFAHKLSCQCVVLY